MMTPCGLFDNLGKQMLNADITVRCMLTPERSIEIQKSIGADIMMQVSRPLSLFFWKHVEID